MVTQGGFKKFRRRISAGSMPSTAAIRLSCCSKAKRVFTVPWPRMAPQAGLLVSTR